MTSSKAIVLLIALFLAGALAGGFAGYNVGRRSVVAVQADPVEQPKPGPRPEWRPPPPNNKNVRTRLVEDLQLTDEQMVKIDPIISDFSKQLEDMSKKNWTDLWLAVSNRDERIKPFLTDEQITKLQERRSRRHSMPGPSRGDRGPRGKD